MPNGASGVCHDPFFSAEHGYSGTLFSLVTHATVATLVTGTRGRNRGPAAGAGLATGAVSALACHSPQQAPAAAGQDKMPGRVRPSRITGDAVSRPPPERSSARGSLRERS
jgi:hypothetical protein